MPSFRLTGGHALIGQTMVEQPLSIVDGHIVEDVVSTEIDLSDHMILPGIVDLHGPNCSKTRSDQDRDAPMAETDLVAAQHGVTTAWVIQRWSWEDAGDIVRNSREALSAHAETTAALATDLRVQLLCDTHTMAHQAELVDIVRSFRVQSVLFQTTVDDLLDLWVRAPSEFRCKAEQAGRSPEALFDEVRQLKSRDAEVPRYLCNLATIFDQLGVRYGSHNDADGSVRERYSMIGAKICQSPTSVGAAFVARAWRDPILMPAADVLAHGGDLSAPSSLSLIEKDACNALVSNGDYPALVSAVCQLVDRGHKSLPGAWSMVSSTPAAIAGLTDRGQLFAGKRADLAVVHKNTWQVEGTVAKGQWAYLSQSLLDRLNSAKRRSRLAAE